jgi:hypothetical protein
MSDWRNKLLNHQAMTNREIYDVWSFISGMMVAKGENTWGLPPQMTAYEVVKEAMEGAKRQILNQQG